MPVWGKRGIVLGTANQHVNKNNVVFAIPGIREFLGKERHSELRTNPNGKSGCEDRTSQKVPAVVKEALDEAGHLGRFLGTCRCRCMPRRYLRNNVPGSGCRQ